MEFGRLTDVRDVDFALPAIEDALFGWPTSNRSPEAQCKLYVGAPVWAHKSFIGKIYPPKLKPTDYLQTYAKSFNCIELNSTFYGVPKADRISKWCDVVGTEFRFCPKATRSITHDQTGLPRSAIKEFFVSIAEFGDRLGTCFLQFPPELGPRQWRHLQSLLKLLPSEFSIAIELRHPGWFESRNAFEWILNLGIATGIGLVLTDTAGRRDVLHSCFPQRFSLVRFSADGLVPSDFERLDRWVGLLAQLASHGLREMYFFLHQQTEGNCVELAEHLVTKIPDAGLPPIQRVAGDQQLALW